MEIRVARRKGTGTDGWPADVYVLEDQRGEELLFGKSWPTWAEAEAERVRLTGQADGDE